MSLINEALKRARQTQKRPTALPSGEAALTAPLPLQPVEDTGRDKPQRLLVVIPMLLLSLGTSVWLLWKWKNPEAKAAGSGVSIKLTESQTSRPTKPNALVTATATMAKWQARQESEPPAGPNALGQSESQKSAVQQTKPSLVSATPNGANASLVLPGRSGASSAAPPVADGTSHSGTNSRETPAPSNLAAVANSTSSGTGPSVAPPIDSPPAASPINTTVQPPLPPTTEAKPELKLQGIFYRLKRPTALIDGRVVSLGDDIGGYRVVRIDRDTVKLVVAGRTNTLMLR